MKLVYTSEEHTKNLRLRSACAHVHIAQGRCQISYVGLIVVRVDQVHDLFSGGTAPSGRRDRLNLGTTRDHTWGA